MDEERSHEREMKETKISDREWRDLFNRLSSIDSRVREVEHKLNNGINAHIQHTDVALERLSSLFEEFSHKFHSFVLDTSVRIQSFEDANNRSTQSHTVTRQWILAIASVMGAVGTVLGFAL